MGYVQLRLSRGTGDKCTVTCGQSSVGAKDFAGNWEALITAEKLAVEFEVSEKRAKRANWKRVGEL
jgi:hypothetical protein